MKKVIVTLMIAVSFSTFLYAADQIVLPAKNGNITFNHKKHSDMMASTAKKCTTCHSSMSGGKIDGFGKDMAHKNCRGCHEEKKQGPSKCGQCHKK